MEDLLGQDDIIWRSSAMNEAPLKRANNISKERSDAIHQDFGYDLVDHVAKTDRSEFLKLWKPSGLGAFKGFMLKTTDSISSKETGELMVLEASGLNIGN
ncbi:hypothetical protein PIB30_082223 [Stylosanthes scabra]|uniref:Uncharacterized protein n=1 Tax=Stylosanthes scabra TaxID=79078 RepID=A0ABU6QRH4_9FABA|nr:hypothetical protein [Stylosanthes scabra]